MEQDLAAVIAERWPGLSKLERRVAAYLTAHPDALLVETSGTIAARAFVSPMTVTRFFRKLGFDNAAQVKLQMRQRFQRSMPSGLGGRFERFQRLRHGIDAEGGLKEAAAALRIATEQRDTPAWQEVVRSIAHADSVFAAGFQTMSYLATGLVLRLNYVRPNVHELDGADGVYAKFFADPAPRRTLVIVDSFRYARNGPVLAKVARDRGADVVIFCDEQCEWAAGLTPHVFALPSEAGFFFRPTTAVHFALHLLVQDVIDELGEPVRRQLELLSEAQEQFGQFLK